MRQNVDLVWDGGIAPEAETIPMTQDSVDLFWAKKELANQFSVWIQKFALENTESILAQMELNLEYQKILSEYSFLAVQNQSESFKLENLVLSQIVSLKRINFDEKKVLFFLLNLEIAQNKSVLMEKIKCLYKSEENAEKADNQNNLSPFYRKKRFEELTQKAKDELTDYVAKNYLGRQSNLEWILGVAKLKGLLEKCGIVREGKIITQIPLEVAKYCEMYFDPGQWSRFNYFNQWDYNFDRQNEQEAIIPNVFQEAGLVKFAEIERQKNVVYVNQKQVEFCERNGFELGFDKLDQFKRSLVLYYRENIRENDFAVIAETVRQYVEEGYARVFNEVALASRFRFKYPANLTKKINYRDVVGKDFQDLCSLYANTIHLEHGTPFEFMRGAPPILSEAVCMDRTKIQDLQEGQDYIPLNLFLDRTDRRISRNICDGNPVAMAKEIIRAIQELEKLLLKDF